MATPERVLTERLRAAFAAVSGNGADPVVRPSQHADFQANGALPAAKAAGRNPRELAAEVIAAGDSPLTAREADVLAMAARWRRSPVGLPCRPGPSGTTCPPR